MSVFGKPPITHRGHDWLYAGSIHGLDIYYGTAPLRHKYGQFKEAPVIVRYGPGPDDRWIFPSHTLFIQALRRDHRLRAVRWVLQNTGVPGYG